MKKKILIATLILTLLMTFTAFAKSGDWKEDGGRWWYEYDDGSYPANCVREIDEKYYAFDVNGYMYDNSWLQLSDDTWIYATGSGALARNQWIGNYYIGSEYRMLVNTWTPDGYYVGPDGAWIPGMEQRGSGTISDIDIGYYNSVGYNGDYQDYRVDAWVSYSGSSKQINFGHYEPRGSMYNYYDSVNPNGDCLEFTESNGKIYGISTKDGASYPVTVEDGVIRIQWKRVTWNGSNDIVLEYRDDLGDAVG